MKWKLWIIYTPFPFIFYNEWQIIFYFISQGLFHDWLAQKGKLGGQHKVPRLSNTREYIEAMLVLNNSAHPEE